MGLWAVAGSHAMSYMTDGLVEAWFVESWPRGHELAHRLVDVGLWSECDGGWMFHDWAGYQPTRAQVEAKREADRERQAKRRRSDNGRYVEDVSRRDTERTPAGSHAVSHVHPVPSRPVPSQDSLVTSQESVTEVDARERTDSLNQSLELCQGESARERARAVGITNPAEVVQAVWDECGRVIFPAVVPALAHHLTSKARTMVKNPHAYVLRAIVLAPFEVQKYLDEEALAC